jgi:hypothetical protein
MSVILALTVDVVSSADLQVRTAVAFRPFFVGFFFVLKRLHHLRDLGRLLLRGVYALGEGQGWMPEDR